MKSLARFACLSVALLASVPSGAADVYVDGNNCGSLTSLQVNGATGRVDISTSASANPCKIGTAEPPPPPPAGTFALTVTAPTGGTISSAPAGISCPGDCSENVAENVQVTLTATPSGTGYSHGNWGGACQGPTDQPCGLTMTEAKAVSATFTYTPPANPGCPANTTCITRNWPISTTENFSLVGAQALSIRINTTAEGVAGKLVTGYTSGISADREVAFSSTPGDFSAVLPCRKTGNLSTNNTWIQSTTGSASQCKLPVAGVAYINIRHTSCGPASSCSFYLSSY